MTAERPTRRRSRARRTLVTAAKVAAGVAALLGVAVGIVAYVTFAGIAPIEDHARVGPAITVADGYVASFLLETGDGRLVLIDAGQQPDAAPILAAIRDAGYEQDDVTAILLTHGHSDHRGGMARFPQARVYAHVDERPLLAGEVTAKGPLPRLSGRLEPIEVTHPVEDGQRITIGDLSARVFHVPGHTSGNVVWLVGDTLFMGDVGHAVESGEIEPSPWVFSDDTDRAAACLASLAQRLEEEGVEVDQLVFSHSAPLSGLEPLERFAANHAAEESCRLPSR